MQALHAIYEYGIFRPTEPVNLPELCEVEIVVKSLPNVVKPLTLARLAELGRSFPTNPELPEDLAAQHDYYLYGLPKQP